MIPPWFGCLFWRVFGLFVSSCFSTTRYEQPILNRDLLPMPPLRLRVALNAGQELRYSRRYNYDRRRLGWLLRMFNMEACPFPRSWSGGCFFGVP